MCICMYVYIYIERERDFYIIVYVFRRSLARCSVGRRMTDTCPCAMHIGETSKLICRIYTMLQEHATVTV